MLFDWLCSIQLDNCWILYFNETAHLFLLPRRYLHYSHFCNTKTSQFLIIFTGKIPVFFGRYVCSSWTSQKYARIILLLLFTMKFFCFLFRINFSKKLNFFAFWWKKIRRHLVKSVLLSLVPTAVISSIARLRGRR